MQPLRNLNGPTIRIGREILCLPYAGFFYKVVGLFSGGSVINRTYPVQFILQGIPTQGVSSHIRFTTVSTYLFHAHLPLFSHPCWILLTPISIKGQTESLKQISFTKYSESQIVFSPEYHYFGHIKDFLYIILVGQSALGKSHHIPKYVIVVLQF